MFDRLTVLSLSDKRSSTGHIYLHCICSCGNKFEARAHNVLSGNTKSCGCFSLETRAANRRKQKEEAKARSESLIGKKFGALIITGVSDKKTRFGHAYVKAMCSCGKSDVDVMVSSLFNRRVLSCGCRIIGGKKGRVYIDPIVAAAKNAYRGSYDDGDLSFEDFFKMSQKD